MRSDQLPDSPYYLSKHRYMQLYHFCLQYQEWKSQYNELEGLREHADALPIQTSGHGDPTAGRAIRRAQLAERMKLVEDAAREADPELAEYILKCATDEDVTYTNLSMMHNIPCCSGTFTARKKKFYWLLSQKIN